MNGLKAGTRELEKNSSSWVRRSLRSGAASLPLLTALTGLTGHPFELWGEPA